MHFHVFANSSSHPLGTYCEYTEIRPVCKMIAQTRFKTTQNYRTVTSKTARGRLVRELLIYKRSQLQSY